MSNFKKTLIAVTLSVSMLAPFMASADVSVQDTINQLLAQIAALQAQIKVLQATQMDTEQFCLSITRNLYIGQSGEDVVQLSIALGKEGFNASMEEKGVFGENMAAAVVGFQEKYRDEILTPAGLAHGTGYVGVATRKKLMSLYGCSMVKYPSFISDIRVGSTKAGQGLIPGGDMLIQWNNSKDISQVYIKLRKGSIGDTIRSVSGVINNSGSYIWHIPADLSPADDYVVRVIDSRTRASADSISFSIVAVSSATPSITVISPNGGETWQKDTTQIINWKYKDNCVVGIVCIPPAPKNYRLTLMSYQSPCPIGSSCPTYLPALFTITTNVVSNSYDWMVGKVFDPSGKQIALPDGMYMVQVCENSTNTCDQSDSYFKITSPNTQAVPVISNPNNYNQTSSSVAISWDTDKLSTSVVRYWLNSDQNKTTVSDNNQTLHHAIFLTNLVPASLYSYEMFSSDSAGNISQSAGVYNFTTLSSTQSSITLTYPKGGEMLQQGQTYNVTWSRANFNDEVAINLIDYTPGSRYGMQYAITNGTTIRTVPGQTSFSWTIPSSIPAGNYYKVVVGMGSTNAFSDNYFTITAPTTQPSIAVLSPNGGETIHQGDQVTIRWTSTGGPSYVGLNLQQNGNNLFGIANALNTGSYAWTVPATVSGSGFTIQAIGQGVIDTSDAPFSIAVPSTQPSITVLSPNSSQFARVGDTLSLAWMTTGSVSNAIGARLCQTTNVSSCNQPVAIGIYPQGNNSFTSSLALQDVMTVSPGTWYVNIVDLNNQTVSGFSAPFSIIVATPLVSVNLSADKTIGNIPFAVTLTATLNNLPSCGNMYKWDFGDGPVATTADVCFGDRVSTTTTRTMQASHTYQSAGSYNAKLTVNNTVSNVVTVIATASSTQTQATLNVATTGNSYGVVFGDKTGISCGRMQNGTIYDDCSESYSLSTIQSSTVQLAAFFIPSGSSVVWTGCDSSNGNQCTVTMNQSRRVIAQFNTAQPLVTVSSSSTSGPVPFSVTLTATLNNLPSCGNMYKWDFGDGPVATTADVCFGDRVSTTTTRTMQASHTYQSAGSYNAKLTVNNTISNVVTVIATASPTPNTANSYDAIKAALNSIQTAINNLRR